MSPDTPMQTPARQRLLGIQFARGLAAVLVVLYHTGRGLALPQYVGAIPLGGVFNFGHAGVDFFFVLSGFVIFYVHHGDIGDPAALPRYVWRRLARIYPIYWVVTAAVVAITLVKPDAAAILRPDVVVRSLLLLPQQNDPLLGVAWTLVFEMAFYTVFALAILWRPLGLAAAAGWVGMLLLGYAGTEFSWPILRLFAGSYNMDFLFGIAAAHVALHRHPARPLLLVAIGVAVFLLSGVAEDAGLIRTAGLISKLLFGLAAAACVLGLAVAERQGRLHLGRAATRLGNASYAIYLVHTIVIGLAARALATLQVLPVLPGAVALVVVAVLAVAVGVVLHQIVERPMLVWLAARTPGRRLRPAALPGATP